MPIIHEPIIDKCVGCLRVKTGPEGGPSICLAYLTPEAKWRGVAKCPLASHIKREEVESKFVDPLKASKRKAAGK